MNSLPWLSMLIFIPLAGALVCLGVRARRLVRGAALCTMLLEFLVAGIVLGLFDPTANTAFQLVERHAWIPGLNVQYLLGVDGIAVLFLPFTALLGIMAVLASWKPVDRLPGFYYAMLLTLLGVTMGVFLALDTMLFFLFWELTLPPIYFLASLWGTGSGRRIAAMKYTMTMMFGGIPLLFAFIILALNAGDGILVFSFPALLQSPLAAGLQPVVFLLLVLGFATKAPLFPFHTWVPSIAMESPAQLTALLVGLKLGVFGLLRFAFPLAPQAALDYAWIMGILGGFTLVYGALIALQQSNLRRMLAYASISHVGLVVIGIASLTTQGFQGAVFQLLNFTMIASGLMFLGGFLQQRFGSTELGDLGNLASGMPRLATLFFLLAMASIGLPGTSGFIAELLLITAAFRLHFSLGIAALAAIVLAAAYLLTHARRTFWGPPKPHSTAGPDLRTEEMLILAPACLFVLVVGFFPALVTDIIAQATGFWVALFA